MPALFVTATDTAVGKTIVASALAEAWRGSGRRVGVMKPLACGGDFDTRLLMAASQSQDPIELVTPLQFSAPLAPNVAAPREGRTVELSLADAALEKLRRAHNLLIVEGLGGALAPLTDDVAAIDWAAKHGLPALVVARTDLGTLNHTLLTLEALAARNVPVLGVVLNRSHGGEVGLAEETNPETLRRLIRVPLWGPVPFVSEIVETDPIEDVAKRLPLIPFAAEILAALTQKS